MQLGLVVCRLPQIFLCQVPTLTAIRSPWLPRAAPPSFLPLSSRFIPHHDNCLCKRGSWPQPLSAEPLAATATCAPGSAASRMSHQMQEIPFSVSWGQVSFSSWALQPAEGSLFSATSPAWHGWVQALEVDQDALGQTGACRRSWAKGRGSRRERRTGRSSPWFGFHSTMVTVGAHTRDMPHLLSPLLFGSAARPYLHPPCPMLWHHPPNPRCICQPPLPLLLPPSLQLKQDK